MNTSDNANGKQQNIWPIFLLTCLIVGILYVILKGSAFSGYPKLTDLIIDLIAIEGSNKTGEWTLFWTLTWVGCGLCLLFFVIRYFLSVKHDFASSKSASKPKLPHAVFCLVIFLPAAVMTVLYADAVLYLWLFSGIFYLNAVFFKEQIREYAALFLFLYFDFQAVVVALSIFRITDFYRDSLLFAVPAAVFLLLLIGNFKLKFLTAENLNRILGILQLPLPLLMLLYIKNTYSWQGQILTLRMPTAYLIFILVVILGMYGYGILEYRKGKSVTTASAVSIFLYGSYIPAALIVPTDLHHYGEQILPYQQIVDFSMTAYQDYAPVSGFYPMMMGFLNSVLFQNKAATFYAACSVMVILFSVVIFYLICMHVEPSEALLFAFLFHIPVYCRTYMILPVLLLWMLPKIRKNKWRFLCIYVFVSFLSGLYYPLFGLALVCAGMPFAIAKFISLVKELSEKYRSGIKSKLSVGILIESLLYFVPILISIPLLFRMARHVLAYANQTLLADGLSLISCEVPEWFIPYLSYGQTMQQIRSFLYYAIRFLVPMAVVWLCFLLLCSFICKNCIQKKQGFKPFLSPAFFGLSGAFLLLPASYTYTIAIMGEGWNCRLFSRSGHVWLWVFGMFLPIILLRFGTDILNSKRSAYAMIAVCVTIGMVSFSYMKDYHYALKDATSNRECSVIGQYTDNLLPYPIGDNMTLVSEDDQKAFERLGSGFMDADTLAMLYHYRDNISVLRAVDPEAHVLGLDIQMYYFLLDEPCFYSGKPSLAKSYDAAKTVFPFLDAHTAVGNDVKSLQSYYIYKEMMKKGYAYDPLTQFYLPKELFVSLYGEDAYENADRSHTPYSRYIYLAKVPAVLFANIPNLADVLTESDAPDDFLAVTVKKEALENALGISIAKDSVFRIDLTPESDPENLYHYLLTDYENGEWLLPLGINEYCMFSHPEDIYISVFSQDDTEHPARICLRDVCDRYQYFKLKM